MPHKMKFTGVIKQSNDHHPGLFIASNIFHCHITKKTINANEAKKLTDGINAPKNKSQGHQCIFEVWKAIIIGPMKPGIHAKFGELNLAFLAIALKTKEV